MMNKNRPVIGVTTMFDAETERYTLKGDYTRMLEALGAVPVLLPLTADPAVLEHYLELCDGLILSGGYDVDPALYGQADEGLCKQIQPVRDEMEFYLCKRAAAEDLPLLGICRGHQVLNAALGGTLYQDLQAQMGTTLQHQVPNPMGGFAHDVSLTADSPLARLLGKGAMAVNSRHHQGVRDLAPGLEVQATAADGTVEAVWMPGKRFLWGIQWHPEGIWDRSEENRKIAEAFLAAAAASAPDNSDWKKPTDDLTDGEVRLILNRTCEADPAKQWLPAYYFDICLTDGTKVGHCDLRIGVNAKIYIGGNIGYGVDAEYRGHHYAAKATKLLLKQAKKHDMDFVFISCVPENEASRRTIEGLGFRYLETAEIPMSNNMYDEGKRHVRVYRIDL